MSTPRNDGTPKSLCAHCNLSKLLPRYTGPGHAQGKKICADCYGQLIYVLSLRRLHNLIQTATKNTSLLIKQRDSALEFYSQYRPSLLREVEVGLLLLTKLDSIQNELQAMCDDLSRMRVKLGKRNRK